MSDKCATDGCEHAAYFCPAHAAIACDEHEANLSAQLDALTKERDELRRVYCARDRLQRLLSFTESQRDASNGTLEVLRAQMIYENDERNKLRAALQVAREALTTFSNCQTYEMNGDCYGVLRGIARAALERIKGTGR